jgi:ornithine cyclodeaminase/alanine dehydrogenase-like protein (mu-crystallin family)
MLVLDRDQVRELLDAGELADALRTAFRSISDGSASVPPRVAALTPAGLLGTMPGYVPGVGLGAKLVTYFRHNHDRGLPGHQALIALFDPDGGRPLALMDGTHITGMRTAGAAAVAAVALARPGSTTVAVVGTGVQGGEHLAAFGRAFPSASLLVAGRTPEHARALAAAYTGVDVAESFETAVREADVICLCTDSAEPVIARSWLAEGCHVSSVGSGLEVDAETVAAARVFVESRSAATQPFPAGSRELAGVDPTSVTEVGEVLLDTRPGRQSPEEITLYKSMGHASQDVVAADVVYRAALAAGVGATLSL